MERVPLVLWVNQVMETVEHVHRVRSGNTRVLQERLAHLARLVTHLRPVPHHVTRQLVDPDNSF